MWVVKIGRGGFTDDYPDEAERDLLRRPPWSGATFLRVHEPSATGEVSNPLPGSTPDLDGAFYRAQASRGGLEPPSCGLGNRRSSPTELSAGTLLGGKSTLHSSPESRARFELALCGLKARCSASELPAHTLRCAALLPGEAGGDRTRNRRGGDHLPTLLLP